MFVTLLRNNYWTDLAEIWSKDRLYPRLTQATFYTENNYAEFFENWNSRGQSRERVLSIK